MPVTVAIGIEWISNLWSCRSASFLKGLPKNFLPDTIGIGKKGTTQFVWCSYDTFRAWFNIRSSLQIAYKMQAASRKFVRNYPYLKKSKINLAVFSTHSEFLKLWHVPISKGWTECSISISLYVKEPLLLFWVPSNSNVGLNKCVNFTASNCP